MGGTCDVLVIGGGVIGLAIAVELRRRGASVALLSRDFQQAASHAAAGMLAPEAEGIPSGPMRDLCRRSLTLYPEWVQKLENLTGQETGYWPCGILAPHYGSAAETRVETQDATAYYLDQQAIHQYQSGLSAEVSGGWWFPEEGQVDNRALASTLRIAAQELGVDLQEGVAVEAIQHQNRLIRCVKTPIGDFQANHYVLAAGAWSNELIPIPVLPRKGQMAAVQSPSSHPQTQPLRRILFGSNIYLAPRQNGRIILGATDEAVGFTPNNTPAGLQQLLNNAIRLYPELQHFPLQECWWGFRPATPDEMPILGPSLHANLTLATGHYRNGVLLAPITAGLITESILQNPDPLLAAFSWQRFHKSTVFPAPLPSLPRPQKIPMQILDRTPQPSTPPLATPDADDAALVIAGRTFASRLMTGTGKYSDFEVMRQSISASGSQIVTVAVRRVQTNAPGHDGLADALDWSKLWMLPNTAGCKTAEEAVRVARLGREMAKLLGQEDNTFIKLEVIPDSKYLLPDPIGTLQAAEQLVKEGFAVLPYINADPLLAKRLEEAGCATVMPLGSAIGSGQGIRNAANIQIMIENTKVPVVVDAGIGTPSEASQAMEMGADALLINTAIAKAQNPIQMGRAMGLATEAGRLAHLAGRIPVKAYASASSPLTGRVGDGVMGK